MLFCATMVGSLLKGRRYGRTIGSACVCAKVIHFPPSLSFLGVAQLLVFKSYNIAAAAAYYTYFGTQAFLTAWFWLSAFMV